MSSCACSQPTLPRAPTWQCGFLLWVGRAFHCKPPSQALELLLCLQAAYSIGDRAVLWLLATQHRYHSYADPPLLSLPWDVPSEHVSLVPTWEGCCECPAQTALGLVAFMAPRGESDLGVGAPQFPLGKLRQADLAPGGWGRQADHSLLLPFFPLPEANWRGQGRAPGW